MLCCVVVVIVVVDVVVDGFLMSKYTNVLKDWQRFMDVYFCKCWYLLRGAIYLFSVLINSFVVLLHFLNSTEIDQEI